MKALSLLLMGLGALFFLPSCTYDPYYGSTSGGFGGGSYYGGTPYYGSSTYGFLRTSNSRWGYDPYRRCYYDHSYRRYYNPVTYRYYSSPPRRYSSPVYPHGYRKGHKLPAPRYDHKKIHNHPTRVPTSTSRYRHGDSRRDHSMNRGTYTRGSSDRNTRGDRTPTRTNTRGDRTPTRTNTRDQRPQERTRSGDQSRTRFNPNTSAQNSGPRGRTEVTRTPSNRDATTTVTTPPARVPQGYAQSRRKSLRQPAGKERRH